MSILTTFRTLRARAALLCLALVVAAPAVTAQTWPTKPITIINPYPPGGGMDVVLRMMAQELSTDLGQSVLVDSKPGAGATISAGYVARATPDGYTLLGSTSQHAVSPSLMKGIPYQFIGSFAPVAVVAESPFVLIVRPGLNVETVPQLVELIKSKGGTMNFGSSGPGGLPHLAGVMLNKVTGANVTHVPFQGTAPAFTALLGGQIDFLFGDVSVMPSVVAGKVKALAATTDKRIPQLPNVPTMTDFYPGFSFVVFIGLEAPFGTPRAVVDRLSATLHKATQSPAFIQRLADASSTPRYMGPDEFNSFKTVEFRKYEQLIKDAGVKVE